MAGKGSYPSPIGYKSIRVGTIDKDRPSPASPGESMSRIAASTLGASSASLSSSAALPAIRGQTPAQLALKKDITQPMIRVLTDPRQMPTASVLSRTSPSRDFSQPPHRYPSRSVDSRSETKTSEPMRPRTEAPMEFVGTSYLNTANPPASPTAPTLPKTFSPLMTKDFSSSPMLANRTANGRILGTAAQRHLVSPSRVPYLPPEVPVGPDNPYQALNDTWTKCWDSEAGAIYYYNNVTGEATWVQPDL